MEERCPKGKEPALEGGGGQWLGQGQACAPSSDELAVGVGSESGPPARRALGSEHPARTPELVCAGGGGWGSVS